MAGWGLVLLCCVHLTAQGVPPGNGAASLSTAIAIVPILGSGGSWAAASPCSRVWDQGAMRQGFGRAKHHPWLFSWLSGISLARLCSSMPHDNQLQTDVGFTGRTGEDLCADVQRWDLQHVGAFTVCVGTAPGQPCPIVPRVPTGINLLVLISLGNLLENALGSYGHMGHPAYWSKLVAEGNQVGQ